MIHFAIGCLILSLTCLALFAGYPLLTGADVSPVPFAVSILATAMSLALVWTVR